MPPEPRYFRDGDRVHVGSLEIHVAEHCNLRCRGCDVGSPQLPPRLLPLEEAAALLPLLAARFRADVFKLVGGEPLLNPQLGELLAAARAAGVGARIRVTTNGHLLHRVPDHVLRLMDELTISHYESARLPPGRLRAEAARAARLGVAVRIKHVDRFLLTWPPEPTRDEAAVRRTYHACWVRHCSPLVRGGVFYKCTRPAYLDDLQRRGACARGPADPPSFAAADGVPLGAPDFAGRALRYLLDPEPLRACAHCLGSSGPQIPHAQLVPLRRRAS